MSIGKELAKAIPKSLVDTIGSIKWTNTHDCPPGYVWNEEGWVQTHEPYLQVCVNTLPYLIKELGEEGLLYQNLLALRYLNTKGKEELISALKFNFRMNFFRYPDELLLSKAAKRAYDVDKLMDVLPSLHKNIFSLYDIWYSKTCSLKGRKQIQAVIKQNYIEQSRRLMSIATKYKTKCVMEFADVSEYSVKKHWKVLNLGKKDRTAKAIGDAIQYLIQEEGKALFDLTQKEIADIAGITERSLREHYDKKRQLL